MASATAWAGACLDVGRLRAAPPARTAGRVIFAAPVRACRRWTLRAWRWLRDVLGLVWRRLKYGFFLFRAYPLPWILRGLFVILFVLAGLKELYWDDSTFGDDPFFNYAALVVWGIGATAVNTALGKIIPSQA